MPSSVRFESMPLNCAAAGHYWKGITPTNKVFYEIPVECNGEGNNFPEQNDYNIEKKRRPSNVENVDVNLFSQFSSPSTSVMSSQKEPLFKKNQSRVSHVNGGESYNQTSGFESLLNPTSIQIHAASLSPKKKKRMQTSRRETTQSKKKFIKLQDKVKQNHKNILNAKKQRAHMNPVRNMQSPDLTSTKNKDLKQPAFLKGTCDKIQECGVLNLQAKKINEKIQQLTEISSKSPKRKPKAVVNAVSVKGQRSIENSKKEKTKSMVSRSSLQNDSCNIEMQLFNDSSKKEICSKKKLKKVPNSSSPHKKNEVSEQKKRTKKYRRINPIESSDNESDMELSIKDKLKPKKLKPIDSETDSDEANTQICMKENASIHKVEPVLPVVITLSVQKLNNLCSALKELKSSESISSNEVDSEKNVSQPVPSEIDSVLIVNEVHCKENRSTSFDPVKKPILKNPYKNSEDPFQDNYHQPAYYTDIVQQVTGSVASVTNVCMPSTSGIESNEIVDLNSPPLHIEIIDVISSDEHEEEDDDDDDVIFIGINKVE